jgi:uncharacterized integral membrane protein
MTVKVRWIFAILALLAVTVFTLQNTQTVTIRLFLWNLELSRALMIFAVFSLGIVIGIFAGNVKVSFWRGRKK